MCAAVLHERKDVIALPSMKERLQRYAALRMENENRLEQLARLRANAELPAQREADGSGQTGSSGDRMARAVERYMEYQQQIKPIIEANRREMEDVRAAVETLDDPMEREVLRLRYIDTNGCRLMRWRDVAIKLYGDDDKRFVDAVFRLHHIAMKKIISQ